MPGNRLLVQLPSATQRLAGVPAESSGRRAWTGLLTTGRRAAGSHLQCKGCNPGREVGAGALPDLQGAWSQSPPSHGVWVGWVRSSVRRPPVPPVPRGRYSLHVLSPSAQARHPEHHPPHRSAGRGGGECSPGGPYRPSLQPPHQRAGSLTLRARLGRQQLLLLIVFLPGLRSCGNQAGPAVRAVKGIIKTNEPVGEPEDAGCAQAWAAPPRRPEDVLAVGRGGLAEGLSWADCSSPALPAHSALSGRVVSRVGDVAEPFSGATCVCPAGCSGSSSCPRGGDRLLDSSSGCGRRAAEATPSVQGQCVCSARPRPEGGQAS